jgi:hypothetical protein
MILQQIQSELKAPKSQRNNFGGYNYRSCEDILEALKPVLAKYNAAVLLSDEIVQMGTRWYIKATAMLKTETESVSVTAFAREAENRKGMDESQITGSASSYARKYALNGLFGIDDTKDADTMDNRQTLTTHKSEDPYSGIEPKHAKALKAAQTADELVDVMAGIKASMGDAFMDVRNRYTIAYKARLAQLQGR